MIPDSAADVGAKVTGAASASHRLAHQLTETVNGFTEWLARYGSVSWDHQSFYAGPLGGRAKSLYYRKPLLGILAVSPMVFCEAFVPTARKVFHRPMRFPIADAHYAMGFALLASTPGDSQHHTAVRYLQHLVKSRCAGFSEHCWGYPFDWVTRNGTIRAETPLITTTPYVYEAFLQVFKLDGNERWRAVLHSIVKHAMQDIGDVPTSPTASSCTYMPNSGSGVVNASAYRAFLLTSAHHELGCAEAASKAERNLNFVLESQQANGSWYYAMDGERHFVDHFHTCFVLKALAKIQSLNPSAACMRAIERGVEYYSSQLLDEHGLPKPFAKAPRLTVYRRELYDYAECVNLCVLLRDSFPVLRRTLTTVLTDLLDRWIKADGSFRSRELTLGWDNVPMHRWAQAQMFRSVALFLSKERISSSTQ